MQFGLVIFDCDGVLIDSEPIAVRTEVACLAEAGIDISAAEIGERYVGISTATMLADIEARYRRRLPADFAARHRQRLRQVFEQELRAIDGVTAAIDALDGRRCIASSSSPERLEHALSLVGLHDRFAPHIFSATMVARGKPAPDLFLHAARQMGAAPADCVVIEDSVPGIAAARAAGMIAVGFCGGGHCRPGHAATLIGQGAIAAIDRMADLAETLRRLG